MKITLKQFKEAILSNTSRCGFGPSGMSGVTSFGLVGVFKDLGLSKDFDFKYRRQSVVRLPLVNEAVLEILLREPKVLELLDLSLDELIEVFNMRYPNVRVYYLLNAYFNGTCVLCKYTRGDHWRYHHKYHKYAACSRLAADEPLKELLIHYITKRS